MYLCHIQYRGGLHALGWGCESENPAADLEPGAAVRYGEEKTARGGGSKWGGGVKIEREEGGQQREKEAKEGRWKVSVRNAPSLEDNPRAGPVCFKSNQSIRINYPSLPPLPLPRVRAHTHNSSPPP